MILRLLISTYLAENPAIRSPHTARLLETSAKHFATYLGKEPEVTDLTDRNVTGYIRHRQALKKAPATVEREVAKLMSLWRFAAAAPYCFVQPPRMRVEKAPPGQPIAFLKWEVRRLFRAAANYDLTIKGLPGAIVLLVMLDTIWDTGERIGALCEVERQDIQIVRAWWGITGGWLTIRSRKGGGRTMVRKLRRQTAKGYAQLLAVNPHAKPLGYVHRGTWYYHLERLLGRADLPTSRLHKFHCLRKSHASHLHVAGGDATDSLGHADPQMTRTRYFDRRITARTHAVDWLFSPLGWWDRLLGLIR